MEKRWYRRRWEESRGDEFDAWGFSTWYLEVDGDGWPLRQVEDYDAGPTLRYGPENLADDFGQLAAAQLDDLEEWTPFAIAAGQFDVAWAKGEVQSPSKCFRPRRWWQRRPR